MSLIPFQLSKLDRLYLKPPPAELFEKLLGYTGQRRWVGFYYQYGCLFLTAGDGVAAGNWQPWLIWHWSLGPEVIESYCFGYDDRQPRHILVLDRKSRTLYAGTIEVAAEVLRQQIPPSEISEGEEASREHLELLKDDYQRRLLHMATEDYRRNRKNLDCGLEKLEIWLGENLAG